jgi:hypothetical protein
MGAMAPMNSYYIAYNAQQDASAGELQNIEDAKCAM